jgi:hypothetical protein
LPIGQKTPLLPFEGPLPFVGVPSLDAELYGSTFYATVRAATGQIAATPITAVNKILATTTSTPLEVKSFVGLPQLVDPEANGLWDRTHLSATYGPGVAPQISVYDIVANNGLVHWLIAVPAAGHDIEVPDLAGFVEDNGALPPGPVVIALTGGVFDTFDYAKLRYRHLRPPGMTAYAADTFAAHIDP